MPDAVTAKPEKKSGSFFGFGKFERKKRLTGKKRRATGFFQLQQRRIRAGFGSFSTQNQVAAVQPDQGAAIAASGTR